MENNAALDSICSLNNPRISAVLDRLHGEASRQLGGLARLLGLALIDAVLRRRISSAEEAQRLKHIYVPTSRKQGTFLYLTARSVAAHRIRSGPTIATSGPDQHSNSLRARPFLILMLRHGPLVILRFGPPVFGALVSSCLKDSA